MPSTSAGSTGVIRPALAAALEPSAVHAGARAARPRCRCPSGVGRLRLVTPALVARAHRAGVEVHVWTVNDPADMTRLLDLGVDGLVTDRADLALPLIAATKLRIPRQSPSRLERERPA